MLDFGNGIIAGGSASDAYPRLKGHSGLEKPEIEVMAVEGSMNDGGQLGTSRSTMRRMSVVLDFGTPANLAAGIAMRRHVTASFTPKVLRTLKSDRGTIDYVVEVAPTFESENLMAPVVASITLISESAYPHGAPGFVQSGNMAPGESTVTGGAVYPLAYPAIYGNVEYSSTPTGTIYTDSKSDVECGLITRVVMLADAPDVAVTFNEDTCKVTGALVQGDVVVIDSEHFTVTVNGVNRLSWWERSSEWPVLQPGPNMIVCSRPAVVSLVWSPLLMGLI